MSCTTLTVRFKMIYLNWLKRAISLDARRCTFCEIELNGATKALANVHYQLSVIGNYKGVMILVI